MDNWQNWAPIVSAATALVAVILGPVISYKIAKAQMRTGTDIAYRQVISPIRQAWIDNLRQCMVEVLHVSLQYYTAGVYDGIDIDSLPDAGESVRSKMNYKMEHILSKMQLMLNPDEQDNKMLIEKLRSCYVQALEDDHVKFPESHKSAEALCKAVLKREWEAVKSGK